MNLQEILERLEGETIVVIDGATMITYNGSRTFNVYEVHDDSLESRECFTVMHATPETAQYEAREWLENN